MIARMISAYMIVRTRSLFEQYAYKNKHVELKFLAIIKFKFQTYMGGTRLVVRSHRARSDFVLRCEPSQKHTCFLPYSLQNFIADRHQLFSALQKKKHTKKSPQNFDYASFHNWGMPVFFSVANSKRLEAFFECSSDLQDQSTAVSTIQQASKLPNTSD